ncbi:MAG TPA: response regulator [Thermomicrobiales bacterium]|jgi:DNA-binding response OmpR family regulator
METRRTILVVEDNPAIAELLRETLTESGYRVLLAATPDAARPILAAFRVGLVLTDAFHDVSGTIWDDLDPLVRLAGGAPLVLCSAHDPALYADFAAHGFASALPKPFDLDEMLALVAALLPPG